MKFEDSNWVKNIKHTCSLLPLSRAWSPWPNWPRRRSLTRARRASSLVPSAPISLARSFAATRTRSPFGRSSARRRPCRLASPPWPPPPLLSSSPFLHPTPSQTNPAAGFTSPPGSSPTISPPLTTAGALPPPLATTVDRRSSWCRRLRPSPREPSTPIGAPRPPPPFFPTLATPPASSLARIRPPSAALPCFLWPGASCVNR